MLRIMKKDLKDQSTFTSTFTPTPSFSLFNIDYLTYLGRVSVLVPGRPCADNEVWVDITESVVPGL